MRAREIRLQSAWRTTGHITRPQIKKSTFMLSEDDKKKLRVRLRRIGGQVDAIGRMIDNDEYCVDILMQLSAATGALGKVGQLILENHLRTCVQEAITEGNKSDREEKLQELVDLFRKYASVID